MDKNINKSFDEIFSKGFQNDEFLSRPEDSDWNKLNKRLDEHQNRNNRKPIVIFWYLLPLLFLLQGWTLFEWQKTKNNLAELKEKIQLIANHKTHDTITQTYSNIIHDTIYKTVIVHKKIILTASKNNLETQKISDLHFLENSNQNFDRKIHNSINKNISLEAHQELDNLQQGNYQYPNDSDIPDDSLFRTPESKSLSSDLTMGGTHQKDSLHISDHEIENETGPSHTEQTDEEIESLLSLKNQENMKLNPVVPSPATTLEQTMKKNMNSNDWKKQIENNNKKYIQNDFYVSLSGGSILPLTRGEIEIASPFSAGLSFEWQRGKNWGILTNIAYASYKYEAEEAFINKFGYPDPQDLGNQFTFSEIEGKRKYFIPSIQIRYYFLPDKRLNYFIGTGFSATMPLKVDIEYEYLNQDLAEHNRVLPDFKSKNIYSYINFQAGAQYQISDNMSLLIKAESIFDLSKNKRFNYFLPQFGIKYFLF